MTNAPQALLDLKEKIESLSFTERNYRAFAGFDGFIDKIQKAVKKKEGGQSVYFSTIREFSERILSIEEESGQVELITERIKIGGNAPILANTLSNMDVHTVCLGAMGFPKIDPVFKDLHQLVQPFTILPPGKSQALEFNDGKLILSELTIFDRYNWSYIKQNSDLEKIKGMVSSCRLVALVDWVNLPHASDIWHGFLTDIIKVNNKKDYLFLFDLCDPSKKTVSQIQDVLKLISEFSVYGKVTLSLNENEMNNIWLALNGYEHFGSEKEKMNIPSVNEAGSFIFHIMNIDTLLVHPMDRTVVFRKDEVIEVLGRVVKQPKVLTGGGDNLNAGYSFGMLSGFDISDCMLLGMAASGSYIENGFSPDRKDLIKYLVQWAKESKQVLQNHK
jgi:hypothetical protein